MNIGLSSFHMVQNGLSFIRDRTVAVTLFNIANTIYNQHFERHVCVEQEQRTSKNGW